MIAAASLLDNPAPTAAWLTSSRVTIGIPFDALCSIVVLVACEMSGLCSTRVTKPVLSDGDQHRADERGAQRRSEVLGGALKAAGLVWVWDGSTADMMTLPSCESSSPAPTPKTASATANAVLR